MATIPIIEMVSVPSNIARCPVCVQALESPKLLPCDHSLCEKCVDKMMEEIQLEEGSRINCPLCNATHEVSELGADFKLTQIFEALQQEDDGNEKEKREIQLKSSGDKRCELCLKQPISHHCEDCHEWVCTDCRSIHLRSRASNNHTVAELSNKSQDVVDQFDKDSKTIRRIIKIQSRNIEKIESEIRKLENQKIVASEITYKLKQKSLKEIKEYFKHIESRIKDLIHRNHQQLGAQKGKLEKELTQLSSKYENLEKLVQEAAADMAIDGLSALKEIEELVAATNVEDVKIKEVEINVQQTKAWDASTAAAVKLSEGGIRLTEGGIPTTGLSALTMTRFRKNKEIELTGNPYMLREIGNEVWLCKGRNGIDIFNDQLEVERTLITRWGFLRDVVGLPNGDLVVACSQGLIHITPNGQEIHTIAHESFSCVVFFNNRLYAYNVTLAIVQISVYNDGKWTKVNTIETPCAKGILATMDVIHGTYSIYNVMNNIYNIINICYGGKIFSITESGQIIHTFGEHGSSSSRRLNYPFICQTDADGTMLIADYCNNRLQIVNRRGEFSTVRLKPGISQPLAALFNDVKLYVVSEKNYTLSSYSFM